MNGAPHYRKPGWFTRTVFNGAVGLSTRLGISVLGSRVLEIRGRKSGLVRRVPVNLLVLDGSEYLVAPRGETEWVRNLRAAAGELDLVLGSRREHRIAAELADDAKARVLRAYLRRWKVEIGVFFEGVGPSSSDAQLRAIAPRHPVFRLERAEPAS